MAKDKHVYLTTPIFYPSDSPHLGHALTVILADCLKRYYGQFNHRCYLMVGTDEHGEKILKCAEAANVPVEEFIAGNVEKFRSLWERLGIRYDKFSRTSDYAHRHLARKIFNQFIDTNQIFFDDWKGWYCTSCEEGYSNRSIGKMAVCKLGHPLDMHNEKSFFLRTGSFKAWLKKEYEEKEHFIVPGHYKRELINNFINDLDDLSISRENLRWGIKVPDRDDQTIYVWFEALLIYLTALNFGNYGKTNTSNFDIYWRNENTKIIHIVGKEIVRFHGIYWPIMLKNMNLRMFDTLLVHGWLMMNNEKMSKSKRNVIDPTLLLDHVSRDGIRFFLMRINWQGDSDVRVEDVFSIHNSYLSNTYGNLVSRFFGLLEKKFNLRLPDNWFVDEYIDILHLNLELDEFINGEYHGMVVSHNVFKIIDKVFNLFRSAGKLVEKYKAWEMGSEDPLFQTLMVFIYKLLCVGSYMLSPVLIDSTPKLFEALGLPKKLNLETFKSEKLFLGKVLPPFHSTLFPRLKFDL